MTTSSDGILTATVDATTASINLVAVFGANVPAPTTNLVSDPNSESASVFATFTNATGPTSGTQAHTGTKSTALTASSAATMAGKTPITFPVVGGVTYVASAWFRPNGTARSCSLAIAWYDSTASIISTTTGSASTETGAAWKQYTATAAAPATAVTAGLVVNVTSPANGEIHFVDDLQLEVGSAPTAYCDGNQTGCRWSGTVNNSISVRDPVTAVTVTRADGTIVRGLNAGSAPGGAATGIDHEAPLGVAVVYTAKAINSSGVVVFTTATATATLTALATGAWLKSLTYPGLSFLATVQTGPDWTYPITQGVFPVIGRASSVIVSDVQQLPTGTLTLLTLTGADQTTLQTLLASGGPFLLQTIAADNDPDRYVSVGPVPAARVTRILQEPARTYALPLTTVDRPSTVGARVTMPTHSYANTSQSLALYSNRTGTYASRA